MDKEVTALHIPEQLIPAPASISPQGQAWLTAAAQRRNSGGGNDVQAGADAALLFLRPMAAGFQGSMETIDLSSGAKLYRATPDGRSGRLAEVAYFDVHGGGFVAGGGEMCQLIAKLRAMDYGAEVYAVDYRLAPQHPFPAALDDCIEAYRKILEQRAASTLVAGGASAGGNLAAALMLRARAEGLGLPLALLLQTPALDMTYAGDSHRTNLYLDVNIGGALDGPDSYAADNDPSNPYLSPLFGDFSKGWSPTLLTTGTRDLLLSDTVRMHRALRKAGIQAELHVSEASPHGGFMGANAPEDAEIMAECRRFVRQAWGLEA
jgi:monoterpene epsilon-lactone hydrolase